MSEKLRKSAEKPENILQSAVWQDFEAAEGNETFFLEGKKWSARGIVVDRGGGRYLYAKYGPKLAGKSALRPAVEGLLGLAREKKAIFVRIEPTWAISVEEMRKMVPAAKKVREINPEHTLVVDLDREEGEFLGEINKNKLRDWRNHEKKGITIRTSREPAEIAILAKLLAATGEKDGFTPQDEEHLRRQMEAGFATLYIAEFSGEFGENSEKMAENGEKTGNLAEKCEKKPIAAALVYDHDGVRYYAHAATDEKFKKLSAGTAVVVQSVVDAKKIGDRWYDFWGITTSEDPRHPWYGFTKFKRLFGGEVVEYAGCYDVPVDIWKYRVYTVVRKVNRFIRKVI